MSKMGSIGKLFVACLFIATFSGCGLVDKLKDLFGGKKDTPEIAAFASSTNSSPLAASSNDKGRVVVYIDNEAALYESEFDDYLVKIMKMYPQLGGSVNVDNLPAAFKKTFLNKIIDQKLILKHAKKSGYNTADKFQKDLAENCRLLEEHMLIQEFEKQLLNSIEITDAQVRSEYDTNKKKYVKSSGGVAVSGVKFGNEAAAKAFLAKASGKGSQFTLIGRQESGGSFKNFGKIDKDSRLPDVPEAIKNVAVKMKKSDISYVRDGKNYWVCHFGDKKETEYYAFDEIKGQIENYLRSQRLQTALSNKMEVIKKSSTVKIVEEALEQKSDMAKKSEKKAAVAA